MTAPGSHAGRSPKLGARLAAQVQDEILFSDFPVGHHLGSERELMARYRVSRSTLREAIRQLEAFGAVRMQRGGGGGLIVAEAPGRLAARSVTTYLSLVDIGWDELFEVRIVLEAFAAGLAARRANESDALKLRALSERLDGGPAPDVVAAHVAMRELIADIGGNPAIALFVAAFNRLTFDAVGQEVGGATFQVAARDAAAAKRRTVEAIVAHDEARAQAEARKELIHRRETLRRLRDLTRQGEASLPDGAEDTIRLEAGYATKLSHRVADRMARELSVASPAPGERLGSETELAARFGVSRAVFREAVHLMETHGLIRARRGQNGGIIAGQVSPDHTVALAAGYLELLRIAPVVLEEARSGVAVVAARLAASRASDNEIAELQRLLGTQLKASGVANLRAAAVVQRQIGEMSGNRAVSLILRVLIATSLGQSPGRLNGASYVELQESHRQLVAAIVARDGALAEGRMMQHLQKARRWLEDVRRQRGPPPPESAG